MYNIYYVVLVHTILIDRIDRSKDSRSSNCMSYILQSDKCCGYGNAANAGQDVQGFDCVRIPGAQINGIPEETRFCGRNQGLVQNPNVPATACCNFIDYGISFDGGLNNALFLFFSHRIPVQDSFSVGHL